MMSLHDQIVQKAIAEMRRQHMTGIKADHLPNFNAPEQIGSYIPDVTGYFGNALVIVEAETTESLTVKHTSDQLAAFYRHVRSVGGYLILAVARQDASTGQSLLQSIGGGANNVRLWTF